MICLSAAHTIERKTLFCIIAQQQKYQATRSEKSCTDSITKQYPTYLHEMFRVENCLLRADEIFTWITSKCIYNLEQKKNYPTLMKHQVYHWSKKGKEKRKREVPQLTDTYNQQGYNMQRKHLLYLPKKLCLSISTRSGSIFFSW